jgi:hypothetical protein
MKLVNKDQEHRLSFGFKFSLLPNALTTLRRPMQGAHEFKANLSYIVGPSLKKNKNKQTNKKNQQQQKKQNKIKPKYLYLVTTR